MRNAFCSAMQTLAETVDYAFLTGDLGFMALEPLQQALGDRFVNAGVAEQNMVTVAAGMARTGFQCWAYSIAPFIYARPFEQVRNDVCFHDADVKLVGNGGGYGYGVMGPTHHALEDYCVLLTLPGLRVHIPIFASDLAEIVPRMAADRHPAYLRLGRCERPPGYVPPAYAPWRRLLDGERGVLVIAGPLAGPVVARALETPATARPAIWGLSELSAGGLAPPAELLQEIARHDALVVAEEHCAHGGVGQMLALELGVRGGLPRRFQACAARGYPTGLYGSQAYHRAASGLDPASVLDAVNALMDRKAT